MLSLSRIPATLEEDVGVRLPDGTQHLMRLKVGALESDEDIIRRLSVGVGAIFTFPGSKYQVASRDPFRVKRLGTTDTEDENSSAAPVVGERWRPRDPRRKAAFTVVAVAEDHVVTDDGRTIQLARFSRYERITAV